VRGPDDVLDLTPLIGSYKVYRPLRGNADLFATAHLIEDGDVVAWDGSDLEMTAELIESPRRCVRIRARTPLPRHGAMGT
jgi:hypothetical protein